jgi:hypothetical protein
MYGMNENETNKMTEFVARKRDEVLKWQQNNISGAASEKMRKMVKEGIPYLGVIGGDYAIIITPNSVGCGFGVRYGYPGFEEEIDVTDYSDW